MTIDEMRAALGLGSDVPDAQVIALYAEFMAGNEPAEPPAEPLSLAQARQQLNMMPDDPTDQDAVILGLIVAAREMVESFTGLVLTRRQIVHHATDFSRLRLTAWPIVSIDAVSYRDFAGADLALPLDAYRYDLSGRPVQLRAAGGGQLPFSREITVVSTAGYETPEQVPQTVKLAMLIIVSHLFLNRQGGEMPSAVAAILRPHRLIFV